MFWLRLDLRTRRSGEVMAANVRGVLVTRIGAYLAIGVCAVLLVITKSLWFAWIEHRGALDEALGGGTSPSSRPSRHRPQRADSLVT
jgi:hypothetical protein